MLIRLFLSVCIAAAASGVAVAEPAGGDADRPACAAELEQVITGRSFNVETSRRASRIDVQRLNRLDTRPSIKCADSS